MLFKKYYSECFKYFLTTSFTVFILVRISFFKSKPKVNNKKFVCQISTTSGSVNFFFLHDEKRHKIVKEKVNRKDRVS